jgi:CO/xanthine dehydrogenase Mo-binding subunit
MFTSVGHRPETLQRLRLGSTRAGQLVAIDHEGTSTVVTEDATFELITQVAGTAMPVRTSRRRVGSHQLHMYRAHGGVKEFLADSARAEDDRLVERYGDTARSPPSPLASIGSRRRRARPSRGCSR